MTRPSQHLIFLEGGRPAGGREGERERVPLSAVAEGGGGVCFSSSPLIDVVLLSDDVFSFAERFSDLVMAIAAIGTCCSKKFVMRKSIVDKR